MRSKWLIVIANNNNVTLIDNRFQKNSKHSESIDFLNKNMSSDWVELKQKR